MVAVTLLTSYPSPFAKLGSAECLDHRWRVQDDAIVERLVGSMGEASAQRQEPARGQHWRPSLHQDCHTSTISARPSEYMIRTATNPHFPLLKHLDPRRHELTYKLLRIAGGFANRNCEVLWEECNATRTITNVPSGSPRPCSKAPIIRAPTKQTARKTRILLRL